METISKIKKIGWGFGLCNMNCEHCYNSSGMKESIPRYSFGELIIVADKICPHIRDINFGTGELACNPNAMELIRYIATKYPHVDIAITSNGYTITQMTPVDIKRNLNDVDISIDFPDSERHNSFRRHGEAWNWAIRSLEILRDVRLQRTITMCLTDQVELEDMLKMLRLADKYEACLRINWYRKTGRGSKNLQISAEKAWSVIEFLADKAVFSSLDSIFAGPLGVKSQPCPAGNFSARIHQDMNVTAYPFLKGKMWTAGNILDSHTSMNDIYNSVSFRKLRNRSIPRCQDCAFKSTCGGGCVTRAALHNNGILEIDDYCPVYYQQMTVVDRLRGKIIVHKQGNLVHDGYLCTTILKPHEGV